MGGQSCGLVVVKHSLLLLFWKVSKLKFSVGVFLLDSMTGVISLEITGEAFATGDVEEVFET